MDRRAYMEKWRAENRERLLDYSRRYYAAHAVERRTYAKQWAARNLDRRRATQRLWDAKNTERRRELWRRWYATNGARVRAKARGRERTPEKREYMRRYFQDHPEINRRNQHRRRAILLGLDRHYTIAEWKSLVRKYGDRCAYCGTREELTVDHRTPLQRGGSNEITNILPACPPCNSKKHTMTEAEFRATLGRGPRSGRSPDSRRALA